MREAKGGVGVKQKISQPSIGRLFQSLLFFSKTTASRVHTQSTASRHPIIGVCMVAWERTYYFTLFLVLYNCAYSMQYKPVSMKYQQYFHYICKKCVTVLRDFLFYNRVCIISVSRHLTPQVTVTPSTHVPSPEVSLSLHPSPCSPDWRRAKFAMSSPRLKAHLFSQTY